MGWHCYDTVTIYNFRAKKELAKIILVKVPQPIVAPFKHAVLKQLDGRLDIVTGESPIFFRSCACLIQDGCILGQTLPVSS